jgi:hypothetical protein
VTFFLTGDDYAERLEVSAAGAAPLDVALVTDGLQPLVLHYATKTAHAPFFRKVFADLAGHPGGEGLQRAVEGYLDSQAVNDCTDDDKTLLLATNRPPSHATAEAAAAATVRQPVPPDPVG